MAGYVGSSAPSGRKPGTGKEKQKTAPDWDEVLSETGRGLATTMASALRGATKATVGGPGDLIELANQLRGSPEAATLLPTSKEVGSILPEVPGGSESYEGLGEYLDPKALAKKGGVSLAALYAGALRKDLHMAHTTNVEKLLKKGEELPHELYNVSFGIGKDKLPEFDGGNLQLIPKLGKFDPKTSGTSLTAIDAYTPRYNQAVGERFEPRRSRREPDQLDSIIEELYGKAGRNSASGRLVDKFISSHAPGGYMAETGNNAKQAWSLPQYGEGGYTKEEFKQAGIPDDLRRQSTVDRFRSFKHFEESPRGAARLQGPEDMSENTISGIINSAQNFASNVANDIPTDPWLAETFKMHGIRPDSEEATMMKLRLAAQGGVENKQIQQQAQQAIKNLRHTPSDYAELKQWGPLQLNPENFAGAILTRTPSMSDATVAALRSRFEKRGIPLEIADPRGKWFQDYEAPHEIANRLQGQPPLKPQKKAELPPGISPEELDMLHALPELHGKAPTDFTPAQIQWLIENDPMNPIFNGVE